MKMHKSIAAIAPGAALFFAAAHADTQTYDFSGFTRLSASAGVDVRATVGEDYSVRAEGDADNIERLKIRLRDDRLEIGRESSRLFSRWKGGKPPVVYVSLPSLSEGEASSGADFRATGISAERFRASVSSGADLYLSGECVGLNASASSGADLHAQNFVCRDVEVSVSSGADAKVHASESIDASASSGGDVRVFGSPQKRDISRSSGGDVDIE